MTSLGNRRRVLLLSALLAVVVLVLLALPMLGLPRDARVAKEELEAASDALVAGDLDAADEHVARAREHVDEAHADVQGLGGDIWSLIPFLGTPVDDARHLVRALDEVTTVAEIGADLYPSVAGNRATLFRDEQVDRDTMEQVIAAASEIREHLVSADDALSAVKATTPFVGDTIAAQRDAAADKVRPLARTAVDIEPLLARLPGLLGFDGPRTYLIAMLNPAELRYSGGAGLSFAPLRWTEGRLELGESVDTVDDPRLLAEIDWQKVAGNIFHPRTGRIVTSTFAPSWSVSGEELLRAWRSARGEKYDGVVAVDVVALSQLVGVTGPLAVAGYGELDRDNMVKALIGSYDNYYPDTTVQDALNKSVISAFQSRLFGGGEYVAKLKALAAAADGRHFALYFRDDEVQEAIADAGLAGELTSPQGDYLGVFTQNTNASKMDFYQRRRVALDVRLNADGSASNRLRVQVHNDSPPYTLPVPDPGIGPFTRWAGMALGVFLPDGVTVGKASLREEPFEAEVRDFYGHDFVGRGSLLEPGATADLDMRYRVPAAADVDESGDLLYHLALDPQGTVNPQALDVVVHLPRGYRATALPEGWTSDGSTLTYSTQALDATTTWQIPVEASA